MTDTTTEPPPDTLVIRMVSTDVPETLTHTDGSRTEGIVHVTHEAGTLAPTRMHNSCGPRCRCRL